MHAVVEIAAVPTSTHGAGSIVNILFANEDPHLCFEFLRARFRVAMKGVKISEGTLAVRFTTDDADPLWAVIEWTFPAGALERYLIQRLGELPA